jgi:hypothetical protein
LRRDQVHNLKFAVLEIQPRLGLRIKFLEEYQPSAVRESVNWKSASALKPSVRGTDRVVTSAQRSAPSATEWAMAPTKRARSAIPESSATTVFSFVALDVCAHPDSPNAMGNSARIVAARSTVRLPFRLGAI